MLQIENLYHRYPQSQEFALQNIQLDISQGQAIGLLGPNGAGKTTLMSLLCGLLAVQQGQIYFEGVPFHKLSKQQRHQLSLVPQDFAFYPLLTVWENLKFFAALYHINDKNWLIELLEKVGLTSYKSKLAKHLSGGLKRRLNFAIGLINRPKVIFLDEITVGIDPQSRQFILNSVAELTQQGITVIYTSHYLQEIEQLCDQLVLLNEGKLIYQGEIKGMLAEGQSLEHFYLDFLQQAGNKC
ncbi:MULTISPECIES: ABC transporter ATP-binding protein [unclassified Avibacterium]|uniref:ABC transporter ATP-binding protein n=1 Tax=unclassified Avibacterium TaxID=2685287 RepID=UPI0020272884|nr:MULTISPECIES: ABC transporter ATP-binding protein [unclassified Avibacterium]MCW9698925.1 ABC transporter ATP-binding protein [Avibacterium sp. 20-129]URL07571.1 ABC transporter ATP-binding protein [Avibacterium sp. 21-595]